MGFDPVLKPRVTLSGEETYRFHHRHRSPTFSSDQTLRKFVSQKFWGVGSHKYEPILMDYPKVVDQYGPGVPLIPGHT